MRRIRRRNQKDLGLIWFREQVKEELRALLQSTGLAQCGEGCCRQWRVQVRSTWSRDDDIRWAMMSSRSLRDL